MRFGNVNFRQSVLNIVRSGDKDAPAPDKDPGQGNSPRRSLGLALKNQGSALRKMLFKNSVKVTPDTSGAVPPRKSGRPLQSAGLRSPRPPLHDPRLPPQGDRNPAQARVQRDRPPALPPRPEPRPLPARPAVSKHGLAVGGIRLRTHAEEKIKNGLTRITYHDGGQPRVGYFKQSVRNEAPLSKGLAMGIDYANPRFSQREAAAALIGRKLIPGMVPRTRLAEHNGAAGALQDKAPGRMAVAWLDDASLKLPTKLTANRRFQEQLSDMQAFDYLIGNVDGHLENYLLDSRGNIHAIDRELSFPTVHESRLANLDDSKFAGLPHGYSDRMKTLLFELDNQWIDQHLGTLLADDQIQRVKERLVTLKLDLVDKIALPARASAHYTELRL